MSWNLNNLKRGAALLILGSIVGVLVAACGGGGGGGAAPASSTGTIVGVVASNATGTPIAGATVSVGTNTVTTGTDGSYTIPGVAVTDRAVVNISASNYAPGSKVTAVFAGGTSRSDAALLPVTYTATLANLATQQTVVVPGSSATVVLPANSLATASGAAPSGNISVSVTPIDPSSNPQIMPGDFSTSAGEQLESLGAMNVSMVDATGAPLNVASGSSSTIRIPVAATNQAGTPPATMPLWHYNTTTGQWVNEGTLTLGGIAPNQYYEGTVTHFSTWNADQVLNTTCVTGKVVDVNGNAVAHAHVEAQGQGYNGTSAAYSAADGTFTIKLKALASAIVVASTDVALSNSVVVAGGAAGATCTPMLSNLSLGATTGSAKIKLTWGTNPSDLDSHLTGPTADPLTRFHVYYGNTGSLALAPNAQLDVDDTTSFGPEVITINTFIPGVYRYSVHHYSGLGAIDTSPARVELTLNGVTRVFTPPSPGATVLGTGSVWVVFELTVDTSGNITVTPVNTYQTNVSASAVAVQVSGKPLLSGGNW